MNSWAKASEFTLNLYMFSNSRKMVAAATIFAQTIVKIVTPTINECSQDYGLSYVNGQVWL